MSEFTIRSESVDVEQIMTQIRARILEKRGADYTDKPPVSSLPRPPRSEPAQ